MEMLHALCVVKTSNIVLQESPGYSAKYVKDGVTMTALPEKAVEASCVIFASVIDQCRLVTVC